MARMVPFPMLPSKSGAERHLYELFLEDLPDEYVVYHSVDWVLAGRIQPVEGEADFVIAHPVDGVLALEVKGGELHYDPATRRWTQSGRSGTHHLAKDPFDQVQGEIRALIEILSAQPESDRWMPAYGYALAFPDGRYAEDAHPGAPAALVIDHDDLPRIANRVREIMAVWRKGREGRRFGGEGMDALALALGKRVAVRTPLGDSFAEQDRIIVELTDNQAWILAYVMHHERVTVSGPAGCGKTLLAVEVARRLGAAGKRTLLTCFNKALAADLRDRIGEAPNVEVAHFHDLAFRLAKEAGLEVTEEADLPDGSSFFEHELPGLLEQAARVLGPRYDAIVVDEAQDFREWWWPALLALHRDPDDGTLYLFADDNQNLYGGAVYPVGKPGMLPPLAQNLRNTKAVHEFVSVFYQGDPRPSSGGPDGQPVQVLDYRDDDDLAHLLGVVLKNLVDEEGVGLEDIVVLTPSRRAKSPLRQRGQVDGFRLSETPEPGAVYATSVHAFKGLERSVVILAEVGDKHEENLADYLYVGGSRARNHLIVLAAQPVAGRIRTLTGAAGA